MFGGILNVRKPFLFIFYPSVGDFEFLHQWKERSLDLYFKTPINVPAPFVSSKHCSSFSRETGTFLMLRAFAFRQGGDDED